MAKLAAMAVMAPMLGFGDQQGEGKRSCSGPVVQARWTHAMEEATPT